MSPIQQMLLGIGAAESTYMENLFDIQLRTGAGSNVTVTNDMKVSDGSMIWTKNRSGQWGVVYDTVRGGSYSLTPNNNNAQANNVAGAVTFNTSGYTIANGNAENNSNSNTYVDWVFKKKEGFCDIVQYTGDGNSGRTVAHSLGSVPGSIWVKRTDSANNWQVYHRSLGNTKYLIMDTQGGGVSSSSRWNNTTPTSSVFTVGDNATVNADGGTYIAYVFSHDNASFGEDGDQVPMACGSYSGNGSNTGPTVDIGFQPQFLMIKRDGDDHWMQFDEARGVYYYQYDADLEIGDSGGAGSEAFDKNWIDFKGGYDDFQEGGFRITTSDSKINSNGDTYYYWAVRRPDGLIGKPAEAGTDVFDCETRTGSDTGAAGQLASSDIPGRVDMTISKRTDSGGEYWVLSSRVMGGFTIKTNANSSMGSGAITANPYDHQSGGVEYTWNNGAGNYSDVVDFTWKRHAGFDCLTYKGNGSEHHSIYHGLGKAPEMIWVKSVDGAAYDWHVYHKDMNGGSQPQDVSMHLNDNDTFSNNEAFNDYAPQPAMFRVGLNNETNQNGYGFFAALFASVDGICKVGSYTGNGSNTGTSVTLGFVPRFLMIRKDGSGAGWNVISSATTFTNSDSKYMQFNETLTLTSTDFAHTTADGFQLQTSNGEVNASSTNYLYYAHA